MLIEIKNRFTGEAINSGDYSDLRSSVVSLVKSGANLYGADLSRADLSRANLSRANLSRADLSRADLYGADLYGADLSGANNAGLVIARTLIVPDGDLRVWKKCSNDVLVHLLIPSDARRSNATGRKCRAEFADVLEVVGADVGVSLHDGKTQYKKGERVACDKWEENRFIECAGGIHFYLTREEAEAN